MRGKKEASEGKGSQEPHWLEKQLLFQGVYVPLPLHRESSGIAHQYQVSPHTTLCPCDQMARVSDMLFFWWVFSKLESWYVMVLDVFSSNVIIVAVQSLHGRCQIPPNTRPLSGPPMPGLDMCSTTCGRPMHQVPEFACFRPTEALEKRGRTPCRLLSYINPPHRGCPSVIGPSSSVFFWGG